MDPSDAAVGCAQPPGRRYPRWIARFDRASGTAERGRGPVHLGAVGTVRTEDRGRHAPAHRSGRAWFNRCTARRGRSAPGEGGVAVASIEKRPDGRYRARWREHPGGPQRSKHFDRKADADRFLDRVRGDLVRGLYVDPNAGRVPFREYAESWRTSQVHRPTTAALVESHLRHHVLPFFGDRPLGSIRSSDVQSWVKGRSAVLAPTTVKVAYRFLSAIFRSALRDRLIVTSPCEQIKLPRIDRRRVVPLETDAVVRLAQAMPVRYRATVILASGAGLRQGEVLGLQVRHVDFLGRNVRVEQQLVTVSGAPFVAPPKTPASIRRVPVGNLVVEELARHFDVAGLTPTDPACLLFTTAQGDPMRRNRFGEIWQRAAKVAKLPPGTTFHALRHYYASLLIRHGESVKVVQERLGHASAAETLDTYSHLWPDSEDRTRQAVDEALGENFRGPAERETSRNARSPRT
jgi:integrase